jgi:preprotein translocase subunit Sss1
MLPGLARSGIRAGALVLLLSVCTLPFLRPSSAEFWASAFAAGLAILFIGALILLLRMSHQSPPGKG